MSMKILIIGGTGTIGKKIVERLEPIHQIITAGKTNGDYQFDMANSESIHGLFDNLGKLDAIICAAGEAKWASFQELSENDYFIGIKSKLMGQVNLCRIGRNHLNEGGSITLTSGILADKPVHMTTSAAMVNGAIHSFVKAVILDLDQNIRINVVSSGLVEDAAEKYSDYFPGHPIIPMSRVVDAYEKCLNSTMNGEIVRIYE